MTAVRLLLLAAAAVLLAVVLRGKPPPPAEPPPEPAVEELRPHEVEVAPEPEVEVTPIYAPADRDGDGRRDGRAGMGHHPSVPAKWNFWFQQAVRKHWPAEYRDQWWRLLAQCFEESALVADAVSRAGAEGVCQFMKATWRELAERHDLEGGRRNPKANIEAAAIYTGALLEVMYAPRPDECRFDWMRILYNWGLGNVKRQVWAVRGTPQCVDAVMDLLPGETRHYVRRINETELLLTGAGQ